MINEPIVEPSCGNVYEDLGLPDAKELFIKSSIAIAIHREIKKRGLKQKEAAALMGIPQPHVSNILHGRLDGFSIERLIRLLEKFDLNFEFSIVPKAVAS